jgi:hypothetical protein
MGLFRKTAHTSKKKLHFSTLFSASWQAASLLFRYMGGFHLLHATKKHEEGLSNEGCNNDAGEIY